MSQWVLTGTGDVMPIQTLRALTPAEYNNHSIKERMEDFTKVIKRKLGDSATPPPSDVPTGDQMYPEHDPDIYVPYEGLYGEDTPPILDVDDESNNTPDLLMNAEVMLPFQGREMQSAQVVGRSKNHEGNTRGTYDKNRYLDTRTYDVMFPDGSVSEYAANIIAESIHSQIDDEGHRYQILDHISDHKVDNKAVKHCDAWVTSKNGN